jgi:hypothetical protein
MTYGFTGFTNKELEFLNRLLMDDGALTYIHKARRNASGGHSTHPLIYIEERLDKHGAGPTGRSILNIYGKLYKEYKNKC